MKDFFRIISIVIVLQLFCGSRKLLAQVQPAFIQILEDKGLQSNTIYDIHVAKSGLLYIAHSKGLSSFDGNHFINYFNKDYPFTELTNIMETESGRIFCKAFNNILYAVQGDSLGRVGNVNSSFGFSPSSVYKEEIISIKQDSIVIDNFIRKTRRVLPLSQGEENFFVSKPIFCGADKFGEKPTVVILDKENQLQLYSSFYPKWTSTHFSNGDIFFVKDKFVRKIFFYNEKEEININTKDEKCLVNYVVSADDMIWVCTTNGLFYRHRLDRNATFKQILHGFNVSCVSKTKENNLFISTIDNGLLFIPNFDVKVHEQKFSNITALSGVKGKLLIGNDRGELFEYDTKNFINSKISNNTSQAFIRFILRDTVGGSQITSGLNSNIGVLKKPFVIKDYCYFNNNILLATNSGIYLYRNNNAPIWIDKYVIANEQDGSKLSKLNFSNEHTSNIKFDSKNNKLYIGNYSGLFEMKDGYEHAIKLAEPNCVLKDICVWNSELLLASKDKGILKWNGTTYEKAFATNPTDGILYKFEVFKKELWILGENAIFCYANNGSNLIRYGNEIGVKAGNVKGIFVTEESVFLNYGKSIIELPKKMLNAQVGKPSFILNSVTNVNQGTLLAPNTVLKHNENFVVFNFSLIAFANAFNTHVAYRINGKELVHLTYYDRVVSLNFLKPDKYKIQFFIVTDNKISEQCVGEFLFTINPPFYNTWWFALITIILLLLLLYFFVKRRVGSLKKEMALKQAKMTLEKELDKSTLTSIKAQMNPHFIFNALNTIQSYVYMNDKRNASIYISKFSDLTRSILNTIFLLMKIYKRNQFLFLLCFCSHT